MEVVLVPREPGKHFIWPGYDIGHKFEVPDIKHPVPENPIQLEMMVSNASPLTHPSSIPCSQPSFRPPFVFRQQLLTRLAAG